MVDRYMPGPEGPIRVPEHLDSERTTSFLIGAGDGGVEIAFCRPTIDPAREPGQAVAEMFVRTFHEVPHFERFVDQLVDARRRFRAMGYGPAKGPEDFKLPPPAD